MTGFCETEDVRLALQESSSSFGSGPLSTSIVEDAIEGASDWFARATNGHWYDSTGTASDLIDTGVASATNVRLDVPSSPHRQDRAIMSDQQGKRYPTTIDGPYARVLLPHLHVTELTTLDVRDRGGDVTDWVADSNFVSGRGEDYYIQRRGQDSYGRTYLHIRASAIGPRTDFGGILTLDYDYGLDYDSEAWDDVRRGIANLAAADVVDDDDVLTQIPNNGQLVGLDTQHDNLMAAASRRLDPYLSALTT